MTWSGIISIANSMLVWIFMARMRDVEDVGRFTIVMGVYALFFSLTALGLMPHMVSEISRRNAVETNERSISEFVSSASVFLIIAAVVLAVAMTASGLAVSNSHQVRISVAALSLSLIPTNLIAVFEAGAMASRRMKLVAAVTTTENLLRTIVPIALIWAGYDIFAICVSFVAVRCVATVVYAVATRIHISQFTFCRREFLKIASACPTFAGTGIISSLNWQAPLFLLAYLATESQTAIFGAASRFLIPVSILLGGYVNAMQPTIVRRVIHEPETCGSFLSKIASYPLVVGVVAAIGSFFLSGTVLYLMFGSDYVNAAPTLNVLVMSVIPFCLVMVASRGLIATGAQRIDLCANTVGFIAGVCAGLIAIPSYGAVGAAISQLVCFSSMAIVEVAYLSRKIGGFRIWGSAAVSSAGVVSIYLLLWNF